MKNRLHDKKAGIAILVALIILSLAEIIFRAAAMGLEAVLTTANLGEQIAVIALAVTILILTAKGKDRACYICYGAWIGYFVLDQLFELPGTIISYLDWVGKQGVLSVSDLPIILRVLSMVSIIVIGTLLVEYLTDKTIYNRAFNILCIVTVVMITANIGFDVYNLIALKFTDAALLIFNNAMRLAMVFMFTFFAYDSAKAQLKKTDLTK